jgi:thiamine biosynthesis lipoprotein
METARRLILETSRRFALLVLAGAAATSPCSAVEFRTGQPVMGTVFQVTVVDDDSQRARRLADAAIAEARRWDDILTVWRAEGELAALNARAGKGPVRISADLAQALQQMRTMVDVTRGAFDPSVGPFVDLWRQQSAAQHLGPTPTTFDAALTLKGRAATLRPGAALDPGAIGKGIALDAAAARLRREKVGAAFLDFGGSTQLALGAPADQPRGWTVVVAGWEDGAVHGVVHLRDAALSTSRASGPGTQAGPIVDPRSGRPIKGRRLVTVSARSAAAADAWSTALVVRGAAGVEDARKAGARVLLEDDGSVWGTAAALSGAAGDAAAR